MDKYAVPALMTVASGLQMASFAKAVGKCRYRLGVKYPETNGPEEFNRCFRAQQNSVEFYPISLGVLWVASAFSHPVLASVLYSGYLIGRHRYFQGYCESTEKRIPGFKMSTRCLVAMMVLALAGIGNSLGRQYFDVDLAKIICDHLPLIKGD